MTLETKNILVALFYFMLGEETSFYHIDMRNINPSLHRIQTMSFPSVINIGSFLEYRKVCLFVLIKKIHSLLSALLPVYLSVNEDLGVVDLRVPSSKSGSRKPHHKYYKTFLHCKNST